MPFNNEPKEITAIELGYLTDEEKLRFILLPDEEIIREGAFNISDDITNFRSTIAEALVPYFGEFKPENLRIISEPADPFYRTLSRTISEYQREKEELLANPKVSKDNKSKLQSFNLSFNPSEIVASLRAFNQLLEDINTTIILRYSASWINAYDHTNLEHLNITRLSKGLVEEVVKRNLKSVNLSHNKIRWLDGSICKLKTLTGLYLGYNLLTSVPKELEDLPSLRNLNLEHNELFHLPDFFNNLTELQYFDVSNNHLTTLPNLSSLEKLYSFRIMGNHFSKLPEYMRDILIRTGNSEFLSIPIPAPEISSQDRSLLEQSILFTPSYWGSMTLHVPPNNAEEEMRALSSRLVLMM